MDTIKYGATGTPEEERNRKAVLDFYEAIINRREYSRALEWLDPGYIQHKPIIPNGPEGVLNFVRGEYKRAPHHKVQIIRCFVDGDYVILHVHVHLMPMEPDRAVMDIFRCKDGKLIEHWDVDQEVPPPEVFVHTNSIF
jgi:predicted SnoaL-like aldol condensation-catalyzing enzyme